MKILSLNEADPLPALGAKVEQPKPLSAMEREAQLTREFETGVYLQPDGTYHESDVQRMYDHLIGAPKIGGHYYCWDGANIIRMNFFDPPSDRP